MTIDEEIKRRIIDLHSNEHVTIREIAKIVKKSSRDIIAVLKVSENKEKADENIDILGMMPATKKEKMDKNMTFL
jgi:predicted RNase H-like nuclease (RuvC/YqgF family)